MAILGPAATGHGFWIPPEIVADALTGALSWTQGSDTWALAGSAQISGALAITEAADVWALSGSALASGALAWTQQANTWALAGASTVLGALAWAQGSDAWALTGYACDYTGAVAGLAEAGCAIAGTGELPPPVVAASYSGGWERYAFDIPTGRRRSKAELQLERERLGILPKRVKQVIAKVAEQQCHEPTNPEAALHRALDRLHLAYRAYYAEVLRKQMQEMRCREEEEVTLLLLM